MSGQSVPRTERLVLRGSSIWVYLSGQWQGGRCYSVDRFWIWIVSVPGLALKALCLEKPLSPGKTGMVGHYIEVPEGLDEFEAVHGEEQSSVGGMYWPQWGEKRGMSLCPFTVKLCSQEAAEVGGHSQRG